MSTQNFALKAYSQALENFATLEKQTRVQTDLDGKQKGNDFAEVLSSSLEKVNGLQSERSDMISAFASGQNQNVHELMIAMQKAGLAMNMTAAVRNKVMEAYKELARMQF